MPVYQHSIFNLSQNYSFENQRENIKSLSLDDQ